MRSSASCDTPIPRQDKPRLRRVAFTLAAAALTSVAATSRAREALQPVYVGHKMCAECHQGAEMGHQQCLWLISDHARSYAALSRPEAKEIARLSGIPEEPQQSLVCLGCHATGAEVEAWERDDTFFMHDGVQCEKCHGPGSEYMDESVMTDREAAVAAGLRMPTKKDCMGCHAEKGSHVAVLNSPPFDIEQAWKAIEHPTPDDWDYLEAHLFPKPNRTAPKYTGVEACAPCHGGTEMGYQYSKWQAGPHARAYASLGTPQAKTIARDRGVAEDPLTSQACLKCHATAYHEPAGGTLPSYSVYEGVGCESCHGAGSEYSPESIMKDEQASLRAGLKPVTQETCDPCHANAHGKPFAYEDALQKIAHPTKLPPLQEAIRYKTPVNLTIRPDGKEMYVACEASDSVIVVDLKTDRKVAEIEVGGQATDVAFSPDGRWAYVSNRLDDTVSRIRVADRKVVATLPVGDEPHGVLSDREGKRLYVLNTLIDGISVIDTERFQEIKRLSAGRRPWSLSLSPDGSHIYASNALSQFVPFRKASYSEVTVIDTERAIIDDRINVPAANLLMGVDWHPSGRFALITLVRTKNLVPMTRLLQGWTKTNGLGIIWRDGRVDQVLLDEPHVCFPDPTDIALTPDGRFALVVSAGSNRVAVVDIERMLSIVESASEYEREHVLPNHLGYPTEFVIRHLKTGHNPRALAIAPDGKKAYVANSLEDTLTVIDLELLQVTGLIDLGGPREITTTRFGERLFHSANVTFHRQFACNTCHPDGHVDGLTYDIEPDGLGVNPVDNRTLRGILDTAPFKWEGTNPSLQRQCGPRLAVFFTRIQPFTPEQLSALDEYICTIARPPNRHRPLGAELTEAQRRGKTVFERTHANDGRLIPKENRCITCHFPPLYTNRTRVDVGSQMELDRGSHFDVPHLSNIYDTAPYMHNGIAHTLEEIWTRYNPYDTHGVTNDLTKDQLNDLIEYLKTL
ncbi:MAG: multiheme c-type cytochrome [Pirellulales bacterium]